MKLDTSELPSVLVPPEPKHEANAVSDFDRFEVPSHELRKRTIRGGLATVVAQVLRFGLQLISTIILAQLLYPEDFGLVGMVTALTGFVAMFKDAGLSMATVQRERITHQQISTLFWINVSISVVLMLVVIACGPLVSRFYGREELTLITMAVSGSFVFSGLAVQHLALLKRQMHFQVIARNEIIALAAGIGITILLACLGCGYWSLVATPIVNAAVLACLSWNSTRWLPGKPHLERDVFSMLSFGAFMSGSSFLTYVRRHLDNVIVGKAFGSVELGLYSRAYALLLLPIQQANAPITNVVIPALSRLQSEPESFRRFYRKAIFLLVSLSLPIAVFAFLTADYIIPAVLGVKWNGAIPIFKALAPAALAGSLNGVSAWVFLSLGRANRHFRTQIIATGLVILGLISGVPWGPIGVAYGFSVGYCIAIPLVIYLSHSDTALNMTDVLFGIWPPAFACGFAVVITRICLQWINPNQPDIIILIVGAVVFSSTYLGIVMSLPHRKIYREVLHQFIGKRNGQ